MVKGVCHFGKILTVGIRSSSSPCRHRRAVLLAGLVVAIAALVAAHQLSRRYAG